MKTTCEPLEGNLVKLTVTVVAADVEKAIADSYARVATQVRVPGFRKGKAPRPIIDTYLGRDRVLAEAQEALVENSYSEAIDAEHLRPIDQPDLGELPGLVEGEDYTYVAEVAVRPHLALTGDWHHMKVTVGAREATESEIDEQIEMMRERFASLEPVEERAVEMGDFALISFVGLVDGAAYEGNVVDKYLYETGRGQMPAEFDDAVIGAKPGDTVSAIFAIPDTTSNPEFAGKTATFDITVHEVKAKQLPAVDEEFATNAGGFDSVEVMRADLKKRLDQSKEVAYLQQLEREAGSALAEHLDGEAPEQMVNTRRDNMLREFFNNLEQRGISLKDYVSATGADPEQIQKDIEQEAAARVKQDLALEALFRAEGMEVTDADVDEEIAALAQSAEKSPEELRREWEEAGVIAVLEETVMHRKAVQWLLDNVEIVEKGPDEAEAPAEEPAKPKRTRKRAAKKEE